MPQRLFALLIVAAIGCKGSAERPDAASAAEAGSAADAGESPVIETAELHSLIADSIEQWDRRIHASCACLVAGGTYGSVDECMHWLGSAPDWADCAMRALAGEVSATERTALQCQLEFQRARADCYEAASCDAVGACEEVEKSCAENDHTLEVLILKACPDTGLLSRLDGGSH
jgi:hypothetical protein